MVHNSYVKERLNCILYLPGNCSLRLRVVLVAQEVLDPVDLEVPADLVQMVQEAQVDLVDTISTDKQHSIPCSTDNKSKFCETARNFEFSDVFNFDYQTGYQEPL